MKQKYTDYFDLLGVEKSATKDDLQRAFLKKAAQWHPDKADEGDVEYFTRIYQDIQNAYRILSNDNSRKQYVDAQQTTDLEFMSAKRETGYEETDQFRLVTDHGVKFDKHAFDSAFNESRSVAEQEALAQLQAGAAETTLKEDDIQDFMKRREADSLGIDRVFDSTTTGKGFDSDTFNRAFDQMKERMPGNGVDLYSGDPMAMFSTGGLAETDDMSGLQFSNGADFTNTKHIDNLVLGQSVNPSLDTLDMAALQTGERYGQEEKMAYGDMESRLAAIQQDRQQLATMDREAFTIVPTEIETIYADLYAPMNVEGLEAPVAAPEEEEEAEAAPVAPSPIRQKINIKKAASALSASE